MATNTTNYNFKKPDESDFYSVQDQNNNWDKADATLKDLDTPTFEDYSGSTTVPDAATAIGNIKSKGKLSTTISNIKAAFKGVCLIGQIVNNCVTNNSKLPLSAAQGKELMDLYTVLNSNLAVKDVTAHFYKNAPVSYILAYKIGHLVQCIFTISAGSSGWVEVAFCDDDVRPLMDVPVYRARSAIADDNAIQVNGTLKAAENKLYIYISKALSTNLSMSCIYPTTR